MSSQTSCLPPSAQQAKNRPAGGSTYGQILKSSFLIGGSTVFTIIFGIVRTKALALIVGPAGVGVFGVFTSIYEFARNVTVMGLNSSGVREIAEATATGNPERIARTTAALRRVIALFGVAGAVLLAALCVPIAQVSFKDSSYAIGVIILSLAVFFGTVSSGQIALLQGTRHIAELARANVLGALLGTLATIPLVYFLREQGIALAMVAIALAALGASWWYSRQIVTERVLMSLAQAFRESSGLLKLGFVFMATALMSLGLSYLVRIIILRKLGANEAGYYHAAWVLGGLYVRFILQAMGADFFPRLTEVAKDNERCNRLVNEQAETSLLLAGPGIVGTLTFASLVIQIFYNASFEPAVAILRWFCLGMMLQVASWPMGFILLAKGSRRAFFWSEFATNTVSLSLLWVCLAEFGLQGAGIAFLLQFAFYWALIYSIVRSISGFRWSTENKRIGLLYAIVMPAVFIAPFSNLSPTIVLVAGSFVTVALGIFSVKRICALVPAERFPKPARRVLRSLGLVS